VTLDQQINLWNAIGTWIAGLATFSAVIVSLWLARHAERVDLAVNVGLRSIFAGDGSPPEQALSFDVTNRGAKPVTVVSIGWVVGTGKARRYCMQTTSAPYTANVPVELAHGKTARFFVSFEITPNWAQEFRQNFLPNLEPRTLRSLRARVHTSVGTTTVVKPEDSVVKLLSGAMRPNPSLKRSANGRPPSPGRRYAVHFRQPGLGALPSSPA
jgi:hypothetical protein